MRRKFVRTISLVALAVAPGAGSLWAQSSDVSYGEVTKVAQVDVGGGSEAATVGGSLLGGVTGYVLGKGSSPGKKRRAMAAGAAAGGLIGNRATRGTNKGFEYTVRLSDGRSVSIVTEQGRIDVGDCVAVERGESANIRRVSQVHCESGEGKPSAEHLSEAQECEAAKAAMLDAETTQALEQAVRRARLLCEE